jgi:hypothetical protein
VKRTLARVELEDRRAWLKSLARLSVEKINPQVDRAAGVRAAERASAPAGWRW